jgi:hypothetical protein
MNGIQSHYEQVKRDVIEYGEVTLKGFKVRETILLLEGSNRMIAAIELNCPITIIVLDDNEIIEHDDDETYSKTTKSMAKATAIELAISIALSDRRSDFRIYDTAEYPNIKVVDRITM